MVIPGVYLISLSTARMVVALGQAEATDFLVAGGYCGWAPGQLQRELDRGRSWTMIAADQKAILRSLWGEDSSIAPQRTQSGYSANGFSELDIGQRQWQRLYSYVNSSVNNEVESVSVQDMALEHWMQTLLSQSSLESSNRLAGGDATAMPEAIAEGAIVRGSATQWLLGSPVQNSVVHAMRLQPAQYLHKSVLLLTEASEDGVTFIMLNGPKVGRTRDPSQHVFFGGTARPSSDQLFSVPGGYITGCIKLPVRALAELIRIGALEIVDDVSLFAIFKVSPEERWEASGGKIETLREAATATLGDKLRTQWFESVVGSDLDS